MVNINSPSIYSNFVHGRYPINFFVTPKSFKLKSFVCAKLHIPAQSCTYLRIAVLLLLLRLQAGADSTYYDLSYKLSLSCYLQITIL